MEKGKGKMEKGKGKREKGMLTGQDRRSSTDSESTAGVTEESSRLA